MVHDDNTLTKIDTKIILKDKNKQIMNENFMTFTFLIIYNDF